MRFEFVVITGPVGPRGWSDDSSPSWDGEREGESDVASPSELAVLGDVVAPV